MTQLKELKENLVSVRSQQSALYELEDKIQKEIVKEKGIEIIESGILRGRKWKYHHHYCRKMGWISFMVAQHGWKELNEILAEGHHYTFSIVKGELAITGDDGDIAIHIKDEHLKKWLNKIQPNIDFESVDAEINDLDGEITERKKLKENLKKMKQRFTISAV